MEREDLLKYMVLKEKIKVQGSLIVYIAKKEYPEQFHENFRVKGSGLERFTIEDEKIELIIEENSAPYDEESITVPFELFLDAEKFREDQRQKKQQHLKRMEEREMTKAKKEEEREREEFEKLRKKYGK